MKTKHTKGEWEIYDAIPDKNERIHIKSNKVITVGINYKSGHPTAIAFAGYKENPEAIANAKLIAAAPIMLESLEHILEYWNRDRNDEAMHDALWEIINTADSAIKKATE